jgi:hypothetical protein
MMHRLILSVAIALGGFEPVVTRAMTNEDVVKMLKAGLEESTITAAVRGTDSAEFDTSATGLITLKQAGVSENVIQEIVARKSGDSSGRGNIKYTKVEDAKVLPAAATVTVGKQYYTRYTFMHEDGEHSATNYWRGALVPINTKVKLLKLKKNSFTIQLVESGEKIAVDNKPEYTSRTGQQVADEMLAEQPTQIDLYGQQVADAIRAGTPRRGMTKTQVLLARGYPPSHETPSLNGPRWKYWQNRFGTRVLMFDGEILAEGGDVY